MSREFKKGKVKEAGADNLNKSYHIVEMGASYPFGQLRQIPGEFTQVLVRKKLICSSRSQQSVLARTASILQRVKNDFLINFHHMEREQSVIYFYYQYAHLTIEKWILDLGDDIVEILKNQMLALANFLNQNDIFFNFAQEFVGLSREIQIRYFLHEFSVLEKGEEQIRAKNLASNKEKIQAYFERFQQDHQQSNKFGLFLSQIVPEMDKCVDSEAMLCSVTTRESWSPISPKMSRIFAPRTSRSKKIHEKLEKSKFKTNQILEKLKNIKNLQF